VATDEETISEEGKAGSKRAVAAGALAGLLGGLVMILAGMLRSDAAGAGFWLPPRNVAAVWYGVEALIAGAGAILVGLLTHLTVSAAWGGLFGVAAGRDSSIWIALSMGIAYGIGVLLVMTLGILPWLNETMAARVAIQPLWFWIGVHLIFGGTVGILTPAFARALAGETVRERDEAGDREQPTERTEPPEGEPA
jgi:hypothetical protein